MSFLLTKVNLFLKTAILSLLNTPGGQETPKSDSFYSHVRKPHSFNRSKKQADVSNEFRRLQIGLITCKNSRFPADSN